MRVNFLIITPVIKPFLWRKSKVMKKLIHLCYNCRLHEVKFYDQKCNKCKIKYAYKKHKERKPRNQKSSEKKMRARLRKMVFSVYPNRCMKCKSIGRMMHADHIKPVSKHRELTYDLMNLQVLCIDCNMKKSNKNENDYRSEQQISKMKEYVENLGYEGKVVRRYLRDNKIEMQRPKRVKTTQAETLIKPKTILRKKLDTRVASQNSTSFTSPI